ncbi:MAG: hypothetical protein ACLQNG_08725 [Acidimicrobiales bacterium]|jgi:hypothetical protein
MRLPIICVIVSIAWISAGMREHEDEFRQAWLQRFGNAPSSGGGAVPKATYKAWYKQFKATGIRPAEWLATLAQGPPGSSAV